MVEPADNSTKENSKDLSLPTGDGVVLDIGTGDGLFVYTAARKNPNKFYIGIDANPRPLEKVSEKIHRKPSKGGLPNVLFLQSSVEDLPRELDGVADEVHVHFPWGSLLRAVAIGDNVVLQNIRRVCSVEAILEVVIGLDPERDRSEIERFGAARFIYRLHRFGSHTSLREGRVRDAGNRVRCLLPSGHGCRLLGRSGLRET